MKTNAARDTVLIENPLTGNDSFARALRLSDGEIAPKWSLPSVAREAVGREVWRGAKKIVLVRETMGRFLSGASLAMNSPAHVLVGYGASDDVARAIAEAARNAGTSHGRAAALVEVMRGALASAGGWDGCGLPTFLRPQSEWLSAKFDMVLPTAHIAEYFNVEGRVSCNRTNRFYRSTGFPAQVSIDLNTSAAVKEIYAKDVTTLNRLLVWSPIPGRVRLLTGYCATCEKEKLAARMPIDLREFVEDEEEDTVPATVEVPVGGEAEEVRPTRRRKPSV